MRWLTNNIGLKLLALLIATALSAYVYYEINYPVPDTLYLTLQPEGLSTDLVLVDELPKTVAVAVRGPYRAIRLVRARELHATLDLSMLKQPASTRLPVIVPHLGDLVITHLDPSDVPVQVDRGKSRVFTLLVDHQGGLDSRYSISDEQWEPKAVRVSGPDSLLNQIAAVQIEPDLSRLNGELDAFDKGTAARLAVMLLDNDHERINSTALRLDPPDVEYSLSVVPSSTTRVLKVIPAYASQPPGDYLLAGLTAKPQYIPVPLELAGNTAHVVRTEPIDLTGKTQSFVARPKLKYPFALPANSDLPSEAEVTVEIVALDDEGPSAVRLGVKVKGVAARYDYVITPPQLKLTSVRLGVLSAEQRGELSALIDADGLKPGDYRLVPQLRLPEELDDARMSPSWVTLTVIEKGR